MAKGLDWQDRRFGKRWPGGLGWCCLCRSLQKAGKTCLVGYVASAFHTTTSTTIYTFTPRSDDHTPPSTLPPYDHSHNPTIPHYYATTPPHFHYRATISMGCRHLTTHRRVARHLRSYTKRAWRLHDILTCGAAFGDAV